MNNGKRVVLDLSNNFFKHPLLNNLTKLLITVVLYVVILTNVNILMYGTVIDIVIFAMWHSLFENILVRITYKYATKYIVLTFGSILIIPVIISAVLAYSVNSSYVMIQTTDMFLGFVVAFMVSRKIVSILLQGTIKRRRYEKLLLEKVEKDV